MGEFPSGQRGQTVNLLRFASVVRIHPLPPKNRLAFASLFFYPLLKQWYIIAVRRISSRAARPPLYLITPLGVYRKNFRNDDIQNFVLIISNSLLCIHYSNRKQILILIKPIYKCNYNKYSINYY